ncbi:hypothetical protein D3C84_1071520 [compost metagenome]
MRVTWVWVSRFDSGVRSSWAMSAEKAESRWKESSRRPSMALKWWAISASSGGMFSSGRRAFSDCAETPRATALMRRNGRRPLRAAQAPSRAVARADRLTVSQIRCCMRCRKCW